MPTFRRVPEPFVGHSSRHPFVCRASLSPRARTSSHVPHNRATAGPVMCEGEEP